MTVRVHVVVGPAGHGVVRHAELLLAQPVFATTPVMRAADAEQLAAALDTLPASAALHVHLTDHLLGSTAPEAAEVFLRLTAGRRVSVTLHDIPQRSDGPGRYERRAQAYAAIAAACDHVVVASAHERDQLHAIGVDPARISVVPLPIEAVSGSVPPEGSVPPAGSVGPTQADASASVAVLGYLYPGKGHAEALDAMAALPAEVEFRAVGAPASGHEDLVDDLADRAAAQGRRSVVTGFVADADLPAELAAVSVPVMARADISASGSIGTWIAHGRRPLVLDGPWVRELLSRNPDSVTLVPSLAALPAAIADALAHPGRTWLPPGYAAQPAPALAATLLAHALTAERVSLVLPYYDQQRELNAMLDALAAQTWPADRLAVVVANDGSAEPEVGERPYDIRVVSQPDEGFRAAAARNLGAAAGNGDPVLFLDADTIPEPEYVAELVAAALGGADLVVGERRHRESGRELSAPQWLAQGYADTADLTRLDERSYRFVISAVSGMRRAAFERLGGFDASFVGYGGEDWELANRAYLAGMSWRHVARAVAWHQGGDFATRGSSTERAHIKNVETRRLAELLTEPGARDPRLVWEHPYVVIEMDCGTADAAYVLLVAAELLAASDARIWLTGAHAPQAVALWPASDPRVALGPPPTRAIELAHWRIRLDRPVHLGQSAAELIARGEANWTLSTASVTVLSTRSVALGRPAPEPRQPTWPTPESDPASVPALEAVWGWSAPW